MNVPQLRFSEFVDEWQWKKLGEVCEINPRTDRLPQEFVYIDLESVKEGFFDGGDIIEKSDAPSRAQRLLRKNDILFQMVRPYQRNNLFFRISDERHYVASTGYAQLRAHGSPQFLYQCLFEENFVNKVIEKCTGSNYPAINSSSLSNIQIPLPSLPEQEKIAECLSSLDNVIENTRERISLLEEYKRGLMQGLFPSIHDNIHNETDSEYNEDDQKVSTPPHHQD